MTQGSTALAVVVGVVVTNGMFGAACSAYADATNGQLYAAGLKAAIAAAIKEEVESRGSELGPGDILAITSDELEAAVGEYCRRMGCPPSQEVASLLLGVITAERAAMAARSMEDKSRVCVLTDRELEIGCYVVHGFTNGAIARELWVTERTVKFHLSNAYRKTKVANRAELVRWFFAHGLADLSGPPRQQPALYAAPAPAEESVAA